jgi:hypothetical protein
MTGDIALLSSHSPRHPPLLPYAYPQHTIPHPPHTHTPHVHVRSGPLVSSVSDQASYPILGLILFLPDQPNVSEVFRSLLLAFSLSLYRHPFICILFSSRLTSYNKFKKENKLLGQGLLAYTCTHHSHPHPLHVNVPHLHVHSGPLVSCVSDQDSCLRRDHSTRY